MIANHLSKLPNPGAYARGWAKLRAADPALRVVNPFDRFGQSMPASQLRAEFAAALDARINARGGVSMVGWDRWFDLLRDRNRIEGSKFYRIRYGGRNILSDKAMKARYPEIDNPKDD